MSQYDDRGPRPRVLPHNLDAEASVLGGIILRNEVLSMIDALEVEDFYDHRHKVVFEAMRNLQATKRPIDVVTLEVEIERQGKLDAVGGIAFLGELTLRVPTADNVEVYAEIVIDHHVTRTAMLAIAEILELGYSGEVGGDELVNLIGGAALNIKATKEAPIVTMGSLIDAEARSVTDDLERRERGESVFAGVPSGIAAIDQQVGGWPVGILSLVLARPAIGKTTFAMATAEASAKMDADADALLVSYEDRGGSFGQRGLAQGSGIQTGAIRARRVRPNEMSALNDGWAAGRKREELFLSAIGMPVEKLVGRVRRENLRRRNERKKPIRAVHIDYIQAMPMPSPKLFGTRDLQVGYISRTLANWAAEDQIAVIAYCQLNRDLEKRDDHRPRLSDIRDSGNLEQDGKFILGLHRPALYDKQQDPSDLRVLVLKNHQGEAQGEISLAIDLPTHKIFDHVFEYTQWRSKTAGYR